VEISAFDWAKFPVNGKQRSFLREASRGDATMKRFLVLLAGLVALPFVLTAPAYAQDGYHIRAGDVLRIEVLEDPSLNRSALVPPDGRISMPMAGAIQASGRSVEDVQADLASRLASNFATTPNVFVSIDKIAEQRTGGGTAVTPTISIYVIGEAAKSGKLSVAPGSTLLQVFAEMGGFSKFAATKRIQLRHTDRRSGAETVRSFNYDAIVNGTSNAGNTRVAEGDVIVVPQRKLFE
jgi:polysaccharide biosynthesis/export protein